MPTSIEFLSRGTLFLMVSGGKDSAVASHYVGFFGYV